MPVISTTESDMPVKRGQFSLGTIRGNAGRFANRWKGTTRENANTQLFWAEFLAVFGVDHKRTVLFERHATRLSTGGNGRIDVFWPGEMVVEQKSGGKNLTNAANQAFDYLDHLDDRERPHTVVVSDFENFEVYDMTSFPFGVVKFKLNQLPQRIGLFSWMAGYTRRSSVVGVEQVANKKAVQKMADLYDALAKENLSEHFTSVFLTRVLFLLFAEDTGLVDRGLFAQVIRDRSIADGSDLGGLLADLFQTLDTDPSRRPSRTDELLMRFPYVNGSVFSEPIPLAHFDAQMRTALLSATDFEWGTISPAIFGSMFQAVKTKDARRELGEHYTTERDILRTLGPLFLDEIKEELNTARFSAKKLQALWDRIAGLDFLDPACGCGNFLVVTYRELREVELQIMERLQELTGDSQTSLLDQTAGLKVSLSQMHGIEIEEWPAKIAETALFITDHQANRRMMEQVGFSPDRLPLQTGAKIVRDNALALDWSLVLEPSNDVIIAGNPPFNGARTVSREQRMDMETVWGSGLNGNFDFVTGWYKKAVDYLGQRNARWAFVSTNSICQGEPVADLWAPILEAGWRCRFAHRSFQWTSEAPGKAAVHVSIIGFDRSAVPKPTLWTYPENSRGEPTQKVVSNINPYLGEGPNVLVRKRSKPMNPDMPPAVFGNMPNDKGNLIVTPEEVQSFRNDPIAAKHLRRFVGSRELINSLDRWCIWLEEDDLGDIQQSQLLHQRVTAVKEYRANSPRQATRKLAATPWRFGEVRHFGTPYLVIPSVVSHAREYLTVELATPETIASNLAFMAKDLDGFLFGVLSSKMFMAWQKAIGGRIKSDPRFSGTYSYNSFPLPSVSDKQRAAIIEAGREVREARTLFANSTLAALYDPLVMPPTLMRAHRYLDRAVDRVFGTRAGYETISERQKVLFSTYASLTGL